MYRYVHVYLWCSLDFEFGRASGATEPRRAVRSKHTCSCRPRHAIQDNRANIFGLGCQSLLGNPKKGLFKCFLRAMANSASRTFKACFSHIQDARERARHALCPLRFRSPTAGPPPQTGPLKELRVPTFDLTPPAIKRLNT